MSARRRAALASGAAISLLLGTMPAAAQEMPQAIEGSKELGGKIGGSSGEYDCYAIEVPAGTEFKVDVSSSDFTPEIWIARGAQCGSVAMQAQSEESTAADKAEVSFTSAGGRYLVFARAKGTGTGTYKIKVLSVNSSESEPAEAGESAEAGQPAEIELSEEDARLALMQSQVKKRNEEIIAENARKAAAERERQRQVALAEQRAAEQRAAEAASGGNSGFLGGLAFGLGAALAGGNAEVVMGAAMKGVEMTTDNEMTRSVLAGKGDAMMSSGLGGGALTGDAAIAAGMAGGSRATLASPPNFGSGCSGMNADNYRDVALSGGGDVQMKTQCAMAYEHYNNYKKAVEQGYGEADVQRALDVYQKSAAYAESANEQIRSTGGGIQQDTRRYSDPPASTAVQSPPPPSSGTATPCNNSGPGSCVTPQ